MLSRTQNETFSDEATTRPGLRPHQPIPGELLEVPMVVRDVEDRTPREPSGDHLVHAPCEDAVAIDVAEDALERLAIVHGIAVAVAVVLGRARRRVGLELHDPGARVPDDRGEPQQLHALGLLDADLTDRPHDHVWQQCWGGCARDGAGRRGRERTETRKRQGGSGEERAESPAHGRRPHVGAAGFEPATSCSQSRCATRLRYAPVFPQVSTDILVASLVAHRSNLT